MTYTSQLRCERCLQLVTVDENLLASCRCAEAAMGDAEPEQWDDRLFVRSLAELRCLAIEHFADEVKGADYEWAEREYDAFEDEVRARAGAFAIRRRPATARRSKRIAEVA
jgi:hypothetical protein